MKTILLAVVSVIALCGCSHNTSMFTLGTSTKLGIDPQNMSLNASYNDGLNLTDISRENSEWIIEIDQEAGLSYDKQTGTLKGVKRLHRRLGPQSTGYLRDLAEADPEAAKQYMEAVKAYWDAQSNSK